MEIISWLVLGLIVGVLWNLSMVDDNKGSMFFNIILGMTGVFSGVLVGDFLGFDQLTGFSIPNQFLAASCAIFLNFLYRLLRT